MRARWALLFVFWGFTAHAQTGTDAPLAELRWLDRITGLQGDVVLPVGETATLGDVTISLRGCRYPEGAISSDAFGLLDIRDDSQEWFSGWMIASSPALNALEHPRYDVWLLRCKIS